MKAIDRVFMTLLMLLIMALSVFVILFCLGVLPMLDLASAIITIESNVVLKIVAVVASIFLFILAVKVLFARTGGAAGHGLRPRQQLAAQRGSPYPDRYRSQRADHHRSHKRHCAESRPEQCQHHRRQLQCAQTGGRPLSGTVGATVADGVSIPEAAAEMEARIKETLSYACGIGEINTDIVIGK